MNANRKAGKAQARRVVSEIVADIRENHEGIGRNQVGRWLPCYSAWRFACLNLTGGEVSRAIDRAFTASN